jgi:hypothetical protein
MNWDASVRYQAVVQYCFIVNLISAVALPLHAAAILPTD